MSLFGYAKITHIKKLVERMDNRLDAADSDRRRIKANADKFGGLLTDLECRVKQLEEAKSHARKHKH